MKKFKTVVSAAVGIALISIVAVLAMFAPMGRPRNGHISAATGISSGGAQESKVTIGANNTSISCSTITRTTRTFSTNYSADSGKWENGANKIKGYEAKVGLQVFVKIDESFRKFINTDYVTSLDLNMSFAITTVYKGTGILGNNSLGYQHLADVSLSSLADVTASGEYDDNIDLAERRRFNNNISASDRIGTQYSSSRYTGAGVAGSKETKDTSDTSRDYDLMDKKAEISQNGGFWIILRGIALTYSSTGLDKCWVSASCKLSQVKLTAGYDVSRASNRSVLPSVGSIGNGIVQNNNLEWYLTDDEGYRFEIDMDNAAYTAVPDANHYFSKWVNRSEDAVAPVYTKGISPNQLFAQPLLYDAMFHSIPVVNLGNVKYNGQNPKLPTLSGAATSWESTVNIPASLATVRYTGTTAYGANYSGTHPTERGNYTMIADVISHEGEIVGTVSKDFEIVKGDWDASVAAVPDVTETYRKGLTLGDIVFGNGWTLAPNENEASVLSFGVYAIDVVWNNPNYETSPVQSARLVINKEMDTAVVKYKKASTGGTEYDLADGVTIKYGETFTILSVITTASGEPAIITETAYGISYIFEIDEQPFDIGNYLIQVWLNGANYDYNSIKVPFVIEKYDFALTDISSATVPSGVKVGENYAINPTYAKPFAWMVNYTGAPAVTYNDNLAKPTAAGNYTVKVKLSGDDFYNEVEFILGQLVISKHDMSKSNVQFDINGDLVYGGAYQVSVSYPNYKGRVDIRYVGTNISYDSVNTKPTKAGTYNIYLTFEGDEYYNGIAEYLYDTFTIQKANGQGVVSMADWVDNVAPNSPVWSTTITEYGAPLIEYSSDGINWNTAVPTTFGIYKVRATWAATENYNELVKIAPFEITKFVKATGSVSIQGITSNLKYGDVYNPSYIFNGDYTNITVEYWQGDKKLDAKPVNAGDYKYVVKCAETDFYLATENSFPYTISKIDGAGKVEIASWVLGDTASTPTFEITKGDYGAPEIMYSSDGVNWTNFAPTTVGDWQVCATWAATENYNELVIIVYFKITEFANNVGELEIIIPESILFGEEYVIDFNITGGDYDVNTAVFEYFYFYLNDAPVAGKPVNAGKYKVKITLAATALYNEVYEIKSFEIKKAEGVGSLTMADWTVKSTPSVPSATFSVGDYGAPVIMYSSDGGDNWSNEKPSAARNNPYKVRATWAATGNFKELVIIADFKINAIIQKDGVVTVGGYSGLVFGDSLNIAITVNEGDYDLAAAIIEYFDKDGVKINAPVNAGEYKIKVTLAATDYYTKFKFNADFTISKANGVGTVTIADWTVGSVESTPDARSSVGDYGAPVIRYSTDGITWSRDIPTQVGEYKVRAVWAATDNFNRLEVIADFKINPVVLKDGELSEIKGLDNLKYGDAVAPEFNVLSGDYDAPVVKYFDKNGKEIAKSEITVGTYKIRIEYAETENYKAMTMEKTFTVSKASAIITVTVKEDGTLQISVKGVKDESFNAVIEYAVAGGDEWITEVPTSAGDYQVKITYPSSDNYNAVNEIREFTIPESEPEDNKGGGQGEPKPVDIEDPEDLGGGKKKTNMGAVVGGSAGGASFLGILGAIVAVLAKKKKKTVEN